MPHHQYWNEYGLSLRNQLLAATRWNGNPLFVVDPPAGQTWWELFLADIPEDQRAACDCPQCAAVFNEVAGLVTIGPSGAIERCLFGSSAYWRVNSPYNYVGLRLCNALASGTVSAPFAPEEATCGSSGNGHLWLELYNPPRFLVTNRAATRAATRAAYDVLSDLTTRYSRATIERACNILSDGSLLAGETALLSCQRALDLKRRILGTRDARRRNGMLWHAAYQNRENYVVLQEAKVRALFNALERKTPPAQIIQAWNDTVDPTFADHPRTLAPAVLARAEAVIEAQGLRPALYRRYAKVDEVPALWLPHYLLSRAELRDEMPNRPNVYLGDVSWAGFLAQLPAYVQIQLFAGRLPYGAICGPADPTAPPILAWDEPEQRNPYNWYVYASGAKAASWNLTEGRWENVSAIVLRPSLWYHPERYGQFAFGAMFCLPGAFDTKNKTSALYTDTLRPDLAEARDYIHNWGSSHPLAGLTPPTQGTYDLAAGVRFAADVRLELRAWTLTESHSFVLTGVN